MKIAFLGTRGIPAHYGGFETAVDEISQRFVNNGYQCDVFCRRSSAQELLSEDKGRNLIYVQGSKHRKLETFVSAIQTGLYLIKHRQEYSHVFWFNNANFPGILLTWLARIPFTVNTDGLEWRRKKWALPFQLYYYLTSWIISRIATRLISDSRGIQEYYQNVFNKNTFFIPYGIPAICDVNDNTQTRILDEYGFQNKRYFLQITRIEPDNLPLEIVRNFQQSGLAEKDFQYVVVGYKEDTSYALMLKEMDGNNGVVVLPANYDPQVLYTLRKNCFCYVHGNSVGGTNPALLEAMASCPRIMAIDISFSRDVLGNLGSFFTIETLNKQFQELIRYPEQDSELLNCVQNRYQWDAVADSYMAITQNQDPTYTPKKI